MTSNLEAREKRVKDDEAKVRKDKKLYDDMILSVVSRENAVEDREKNIQAEINAAANRMIADVKKKYELNYILSTKQLKNEYDEKYESWHKIHDIKYYGMLMFLAVFGIVHGFIYNKTYPEYLQAVIDVILNACKGIGKAVWAIASFVGKLGDLIPNDIAATIIRWILIIAVILGIIIFVCRIILYELFGRLLEYWIEIELWDNATLQISVILIGIATLVPAPFNLVGACLIVFILYIVIRSFVCMRDYEAKVAIIKMLVTTLVIVGASIGIIMYFALTFSQIFK